MKFISKSLLAAVGLVCSVSAHSATFLGTITPGSNVAFGGNAGVTTFEFDWQAGTGVGNLLASFRSGRPAPITAVVLDGSPISFSTASSPQIVNLFNGTLPTGLHSLTVTAVNSWGGSISASPLPVPEPGAVSLVLAGVAVVGIAARRQRQA